MAIRASSRPPGSAIRAISILVAVVAVFAVGQPRAFALPSPQAAPPTPGSARLESVEIKGSSRFTSEQIAAAIGMKPGWIVDRQALQGGADKLAALGVFKDVQFKFSSSPLGVRVVYQVSDAPGVPADFDNFPWIPDSELSNLLTTSGILFDGRAPLSGTVLDRMSEVIEKALDVHGVHARVSHELITQPSTGQQIQEFRAAGVDITIASVTFSDDLAKNNPAIQERVADLIGKPYSRGAIDLFELEQVQPVYFAHAFLRVDFKQPTVTQSGAAGNPLTGKVDVAIQIVPGASYKWGGVEWRGNTALANEELDRLVDIKPGEPVDGNRVKAIWQRAEAMFHQRGYLDAQMDVGTHYNDAPGTVTYTVAFSEGPQFHMGKLVLTGLSLEGERRIRKAWTIEPDATFNEAVYDDFIARGIKQAFVGLPVHYEKIGHFLQEDGANAKVDVLLDFQ